MGKKELTILKKVHFCDILYISIIILKNQKKSTTCTFLIKFQVSF